MRIEEMRSGGAYLNKRRPATGITNFQTRELRLVFPPAPEVVEAKPEPETSNEPRSASELEKSQWTVVSFSGVEAGGLTYDQATRLMKILGENDIHGLCIITDAAALQID